MLVAPIALGYYFVGRYIIAKTFITNENCDNCGLCIRQCPTQSIILVNERPFWKLTCESCMKCMNYCPKRAIETAHSFFFIILAVLIYLVNPFLSAKIMLLVDKFLGGSVAGYEVLKTIVQWSTTILVFAGAYRLLHYLMKYPFFSRLIRYTSFTHWKFWRRYKAPVRF
jgi:Pyruvate/2-oxoacid:ferredoxin oxidoreductase delta subunit